jgi:CRISPR-associated protein (TIGR02584 family)
MPPNYFAIMKTTLLAVTGLSPAIVTETLFALARENPAIIPDRVVFLTTAAGADQIENQLFSKLPAWGGLTVWETLRRSLGAEQHQLIAEAPRLICYPDQHSGREAPLVDIVTPTDNQAAAETIFGAVWDIVRDPDHRLIASIAGGRKTMGALLHAAVSLIGRETDRITHILVDSPYDTLTGFFFPPQPDQALLDRNGRAHEARDARLHLTDIPFVPLRNRFEELDELPGSFMSLRDRLSSALRQDAEREIPIRIDPVQGIFYVDGKSYKANDQQLALLDFILQMHLVGETFQNRPFTPQNAAAEEFLHWIKKNQTRYPDLRVDPEIEGRFISKNLSELRTKLKDAPWKPAKMQFRQAPFRLE